MPADTIHRSSNEWSIDVTGEHFFTTETLQQFNCAGVDPYLIQVAQLVGSRFNIALQGQRNLANAFSSLPQTEFYRRRIGIGFSDRHIARILAESDGGFVFLGILGCLGDYFAEDVVVDVIMKIVGTLLGDSLPEGFEPSDFQWKRLVHLCQGVLATSPFGALVTSNTAYQETVVNNINVLQIVTGLVKMSDIVGGSATPVKHKAAHPLWFAQVAEYLFGLNVVVQAAASHPEGDAADVQFIIQPDEPPLDGKSIDLWPLSKAHQDCMTITGGRVPWERIFRSSFGQAFTDLRALLYRRIYGWRGLPDFSDPPAC